MDFNILASEELQERRKKLCFDCPMIMKNVEYLEQCSACLCFVRAKVKLLSSSCPHAKW
jgi:hypothetical protein